MAMVRTPFVGGPRRAGGAPFPSNIRTRVARSAGGDFRTLPSNPGDHMSASLDRTPAVVFGWARPVPVDVRRLRHPRRDAVLVALAGPATNLVLATISALALSVLPRSPAAASLAAGVRQMAGASLQINCVLAVFNL